MPAETRRRRRRRIARALVTAAALVAIPLAGIGVVIAQVQPAQQPARPVQVPGGLNPDAFTGRESSQGVSVRDSLEAIKKLEDARRMERLEDWNKAADWYQEVIEKYGGYVIPSGVDKDNRQTRYTGIGAPVQEQLAKWPKAGLDAYRNRYGPVAATMLEGARPGDQDTLSRVMKLYFVTEAGKLAGVRLVDLLLEDGEFPEAASVADRLLDWHPNIQVERPKVLFRAALAYHMSGDDKKARARYDELQAKHPGAIGTLFGKDIALGEALDRLLQVTPPAAVASSNSAYRMSPGGDESRSLITSAGGQVGARMATVDYAAIPTGAAVNRVQVGMVQEFDPSGNPQSRRDPRESLGVMPVADGDHLFFQDGSRAYAVSLQSGVPLPGWIQTYPNSNGQFAINNFGFSRNAQYTLTLTDTSVLAVMGYPERMANYGGGAAAGSDRGTRVVCLDRATGRKKWETRPSQLPEEGLRGLDLSGSPLVVADNVYVIARGGKNMAAEDCNVVCLDLNTGAFKWSCFIASASTGGMMYGQVANTDTVSHLAYASGRVFVLTNLGACAALDAYNGTVSWLNIYPREGAGAMEPGWRGMGMRQGGTANVRAWEYNPVVVAEGKVFILPSDSKNVLVYDAVSGNEIKRLPVVDFQRIEEDTVGPKALVAVDGNLMYLTGGNAIYCVDWTLKPDKKDPFIQSFTAFATPIRGRAFVTADSVFVCTESGGAKFGTGKLHRMLRFKQGTRVVSGRVVQSYPKDKDWDEGEGPGNVLVTQDHVVVAGAKRVNVYSDMALARKRLDDDVAAAPADPEPRLRYAEVMFVAGQLPVAMEKLDEAVKLLGGLKNMRPGPERDHLFNDAVQFAAKLWQADRADKDEMIKAVTRLYDLAAAAADGDSQQVNYRVSRARFYRKFNDDTVQPTTYESAIRLYQEILSNPRLRTVPLADEQGGGNTQAAIVAERQIEAVKKEKPEAYAAIEKTATDALAAAATDPALLKAVAESYPNSAAAAKAMVAAAAAYEEQKNPRMAAHTLGLAYRKYGTAAEVPQWLEGMARNYLAMADKSPADKIDTAAARLTAAIRAGAGQTLLSKPMTLPGGRVLAPAGTRLEDALKQVRAFKSEAAAAKLPDFRLRPPRTIEDIEQFREARAKWRQAGADPAAEPKPPGPFADGQPVVVNNVAALVKPPLELRRTHGRADRVVAWQDNAVAIYPVGATEPSGRSAADALTAQPRNLAWLGDDGAQVLVWGDAEIALLDGKTAEKRWSLPLKSLPRIDVVASAGIDETVGNQNNQGGGEIIVAGNARFRRINGRLNQIIPAAPNPALAAGGVEVIAYVQPVDDKIVVATTAGQLFAVRVEGGTLAWHTRLAANAPIGRLAATDDFTVAKVDDASTTQLVVVDTLTGQMVRRMPFNNELGNVPVNFALAPDGTLVWVQQDRLCGKDLFDPKRDLTFEMIAGQTEANRNQNFNDGQMFTPIYAGAVNPDQLLISEGRILVVNNGGKYVSLHSLETGKPIARTQDNGLKTEARLSTTGPDANQPVNDWSVALHVVGSKLYVTGQRTAPVCYDLDKGMSIWNGTLEQQTQPNVNFREPHIGQDYLVVVDRPAVAQTPNPNANNNNPGQPVPAPVQPPVAGGQAAAAKPTVTPLVRTQCYSRARDNESGAESGLLAHVSSLRNEAGVVDVDGVEGGFYYVTGDKKLHFVKGGRAEQKK